MEGLSHARQAIGIFGAAAREEADAGAVPDDLEAEAVPFGFVNPTSPFGGRTDADGARGRIKERRVDTFEIVKIEALRLNGR